MSETPSAGKDTPPVATITDLDKNSSPFVSILKTSLIFKIFTTVVDRYISAFFTSNNRASTTEAAPVAQKY